MKAKTVNQLIKEFCKENSYDESVEELLYIYWKHARKLMVQKENPVLFIVGLGEFTVNRKKLAHKIAKMHAYIDMLNQKDYKGFTKYNNAVQTLQVYKELQTKAHDTVHRRNAFKQKLLHDRQTQNNLEE